MTVRFVPPERRVDYQGAFNSVLKLAAAYAKGNPYTVPAALQELRTAYAGQATETPENLAWIWWTQTVTLAAADFVKFVRSHYLLTEESGKVAEAIETFRKMALPEEPEAQFDPSALLHPSAHAAFEDARKAVAQFVLDLTNRTSFERGGRGISDQVSSCSA